MTEQIPKFIIEGKIIIDIDTITQLEIPVRAGNPNELLENLWTFYDQFYEAEEAYYRAHPERNSLLRRIRKRLGLEIHQVKYSGGNPIER